MVKKKSERLGRIYNSPSDLYKIERQLDAIFQHSRLAYSMIRAYIADQNKKKG